jgi:hypothetical protein
MPRSGVILLAAVALFLMGCAKTQDTSSVGNADSTAAQAPDTSVHVEMLVTELPPEIEGLELVKEGLRVKKGYEVVPQDSTTFAVRRVGDGQLGGRVTCGCRDLIGDFGCIIVPDEIIRCGKVLCSSCGLKVVAGDKEFEIARFQKVLN